MAHHKALQRASHLEKDEHIGRSCLRCLKLKAKQPQNNGSKGTFRLTQDKSLFKQFRGHCAMSSSQHVKRNSTWKGEVTQVETL